MGKVVRRLFQYEEPRFLDLPQSCRVALTLLQVTPPRHCPYGIVDFLDKSTAGVISDNVGDIKACIKKLESEGFIVTDSKAKILFVKKTFYSHIFQNPSTREIGYWLKFISKYEKDSPVISAWLSELKVAMKKFPLKSRRSIVSNFFPEMSIDNASKNPEARDIVEYFSKKFSELGYGTYVPNWVRDIQASNELLNSIDAEEIKSRIDKYLTNDWYMKNQGADMKRFQALVNRFASRDQEPSTEVPGSAYWDIVKNKQKVGSDAG